MDPRPPSDGDFELLPSAEPGVWQFRVARADAVLGPDSGIAAGTTYTAATGMAVRPRVHGWGAYVAAQVEPAGAGHVWQYFVRALPSAAAITEGAFDPIWGRTWEHSYFDLVSNSRPDRADRMSAASATVSVTLNSGATLTLNAGGNVDFQSIRIVLDASERDMGNGLCEVKVVTVESAVVTKAEERLDDETGRTKLVYRTHTLSATKPAGFSTRSDGYFAEVTPVEHNHWLTVTDRVSTLPGSRAEAISNDTQGPGVYWPAVLESYLFTTLAEDDRLSFKKLLTTNMRDPYAGDVRITTRRWQQAVPLTIDAPVAMIANAIRVPGHRMSFSIPECLHGEFSYSEQAFEVPPDYGYSYHIPTGRFTGLNLSFITFTFTATQYTDWPETIVRTRQVFARGVYLITEETFHRPDNFNSSRQTFSSRPWTIYDPWEMPVNP